MTETFPGMDVFHGEMLIGNTLIDHRVVGWRRTVNRLPIVWRYVQDKCKCGHVPSKGDVIEYHLAAEVIAALCDQNRVT